MRAFWGRIGTRMYLALLFVVALTILSSGVGYWNFANAGRHAVQVREASVPALEATWRIRNDAAMLRMLGNANAEDVDADVIAAAERKVVDGLERVAWDTKLQLVAGEAATRARDVGAHLAELLAVRRSSAEQAQRTQDMRREIDLVASGNPELLSTMVIVRASLRAESLETLAKLRRELVLLVNRPPGVDPVYVTLFEEAFDTQEEYLKRRAAVSTVEAELRQDLEAMDGAVLRLLEASRSEAAGTLTAAVETLARGRVALIGISVASVFAGVAVSWLWVGRRLLRRLSRLTERMRQMADGDLETAVPEMGSDEIGELAQALEIFRQNSLEAQRLQLIESLYEQLQEANAETAVLQERLVAQAKLASLGKVTAGVAHEIGNPMSIIINLSALSLEAYHERSQMLVDARGRMSESERELFDELGEDLSGNMERVRANGMRIAELLQRMRTVSADGRAAVTRDFNQVLDTAVTVTVANFQQEYPDFDCEVGIDLDESVATCRFRSQDFAEAVRNLVANGCYAMWKKRQSALDFDEAESYQPELRVSSQLVNGTIEVRVRDNGTGIDAADVERIFDPFYTTRAGQLGAGLGLYIAADVARESGGDLTVSSVQGKYAEFRFTLQHHPTTSPL